MQYSLELLVSIIARAEFRWCLSCSLYCLLFRLQAAVSVQQSKESALTETVKVQCNRVCITQLLPYVCVCGCVCVWVCVCVCGRVHVP